MSRYARVVVESDLIQLDREFDYTIPDALADLKVGQRVRVRIGRSKKLHTAFVVAILNESQFATSPILELVGEDVVLQPEIYDFAKQVSARQCVATGEILAAAIPDHMPRTEVEPQIRIDLPAVEFPELSGVESIPKRSAVLTSARWLEGEIGAFPDWAWLLIRQSYLSLALGKSALIIVPEQEQIGILMRLVELLGLAQFCVEYTPGSKKSERFRAFHKVLASDSLLVLGTRSAIYAPVRNLEQILLLDDADDSLREQGSPFTHVRELAMMRAGKSIGLLFAANYRSLEVQRLIEIGFLSDIALRLPPPRLSFSESGLRVDSAAFKLIRESLSTGSVLVLIPRKGHSAALYCNQCDAKVRCANCGGPAWEPEAGKIRCRLCEQPVLGCRECSGISLRKGRTGSARTVAEFGAAFPGVVITEATAQKKPGRIRSKGQIVIATPGAAPSMSGGYQAVVILDPDVWLSMPIIRAEQNAIRDWMEAIELLAPSGRAHISGLNADLGRALSLGQHREIARKNLSDLGALKLPPTTRIAKIEADQQTISSALDELSKMDVTTLKCDLSPNASALIRFSYSQGIEVASLLRTIALRTNARLIDGAKRRGLRVVMDDPAAL